MVYGMVFFPMPGHHDFLAEIVTWILSIVRRTAKDTDHGVESVVCEVAKS